MKTERSVFMKHSRLARLVAGCAQASCGTAVSPVGRYQNAGRAPTCSHRSARI
jgi:hypothetical protein